MCYIGISSLSVLSIICTHIENNHTFLKMSDIDKALLKFGFLEVTCNLHSGNKLVGQTLSSNVFNESGMNYCVIGHNRHEVPYDISSPYVVKQVNIPPAKT
jgi:hypothetical protein